MIACYIDIKKLRFWLIRSADCEPSLAAGIVTTVINPKQNPTTTPTTTKQPNTMFTKLMQLLLKSKMPTIIFNQHIFAKSLGIGNQREISHNSFVCIWIKPLHIKLITVSLVISFSFYLFIPSHVFSDFSPHHCLLSLLLSSLLCSHLFPLLFTSSQISLVSHLLASYLFPLLSYPYRPYHSSSSPLVASHLLFSPLFASPLNAKNLISPQPKFCLIEITSTARNQKQQNFNLATAVFALAYIHLIYALIYAVLFHLITSIVISSSDLYFIAKPMLSSLTSSNVLIIV